MTAGRVLGSLGCRGTFPLMEASLGRLLLVATGLPE